MSLAQKTSHVADSQDRLIEKFKGKVAVRALVESLSTQEVGAEAALFAVREARDIDTAVGAQLDRIGRVVGEERQGREDEIYRLYLKVRVALNRASGLGDEVLDVMRSVLGDSLDGMDFDYPAGLVINATGVDVDAASVAQILGDVVAAGVGASFIYTEASEADSFYFASGDVEEDETDQGLADDDDELDDGGELADVLEA